jgi:hypothetical protein
MQGERVINGYSRPNLLCDSTCDVDTMTQHAAVQRMSRRKEGVPVLTLVKDQPRSAS